MDGMSLLQCITMYLLFCFRNIQKFIVFHSATSIIYTVKPVLRGHDLWDKAKVVFYDRWPIKRGSIHMKSSMTGQG